MERDDRHIISSLVTTVTDARYTCEAIKTKAERLLAELDVMHKFLHTCPYSVRYYDESDDCRMDIANDKLGTILQELNQLCRFIPVPTPDVFNPEEE